MSFEKITPEDFKTLKPQFHAVADDIIAAYLDLSGLFVDKTWLNETYKAAATAITCHLMTIDGLGTDAESQSFKSGAQHYASIHSGQLTLTRLNAASNGDDGALTWLSSTACGKFYLMLLRLNKSGPRVVTNNPGQEPFFTRHTARKA